MLLKPTNYKDWTWDKLISNGFSTVIQLIVWDLNPEVKWDQIILTILKNYNYNNTLSFEMSLIIEILLVKK
jgi:hypothetical protein